MRILHITPTYVPDIGGIESVVYQLSQYLIGRGHLSDVAHLSPQHSDETIVHKGQRVYRLQLIGNRLLGIAPCLHTIVKNYDLLHVHDPQLMAITGNVWLFGGRKPAVLSTHGGFMHSTKFAWLKRLHKLLLTGLALRRYEELLATSLTDLVYFKPYHPRVILAENGVDVKRLSSREALQDERSLLRWIYWGRFSKNKRLDVLLEYLAECRRRGYPVELMIRGNDFDHLLPDLLRRIDALSLQGSVDIGAGMANDELAREISTRGLFVTATEYEGFGISIVEALGAGLGVVCRDIAPLNGIFRDGEGGLFLRFDGETTDFDKLERLLSASEKERQDMFSQARSVASRYDWSHAGAVFVEAYQRVLDTV